MTPNSYIVISAEGVYSRRGGLQLDTKQLYSDLAITCLLPILGLQLDTKQLYSDLTGATKLLLSLLQLDTKQLYSDFAQDHASY